ncbi:MAG: endolytic transglycosylase MltG [Polyangiaceae bacterium]
MSSGAVALVLAFFAVATAFFVIYPNRRGPGVGRVVDLDVPAHAGPDEIALLLASEGLLKEPRLFAAWVRITGGTGHVVSGRHLLSDDASVRELLARLERRGGGGVARVTFPEGWTRFDMARRLEQKRVVSLRAFLEATTDPAILEELSIPGDSAEGFLFPATYDLAMDDDAADVVRRMKREFDRRWDALSAIHSTALSDVMTSAKLSIRDILVLASMVEKEAVVDDERPIIAGVFLNRLRDPSFKPKRLESDPTAAYGCLASPEKAPSCSSFTGKVTAAIEHDADNPYSTYTHEGLPPGPIANPGTKALEAAMAPALSRYFFFVARGGGRHTFSETYEAHSAAVREWNRR